MHPLFSQTREVILDILFPPICLTCGTRLPTQEKNNHICVSCLAAIAINTTLTCQGADGQRSYPGTVRVFSPSLREILPR